jgi:uncharacterized protein DUF5681
MMEDDTENGGSGPTAPKSTIAAAEISQVGYCRPPEHGRFKPGKSGNPKGRPRVRRNFKTEVSQVLGERVTLREGDRTRKTTKFAAMLQANALSAMKGSVPAFNAQIALLVRTGHLTEEKLEDCAEALSEADQAIIRDYVARNDPLAMPETDDGEGGAT